MFQKIAEMFSCIAMMMMDKMKNLIQHWYKFSYFLFSTFLEFLFHFLVD